MKKLVVLPALLLFGCVLLSFTNSNITNENINNTEIGYLPSNCDEPVYFQIESQLPCNLLKVNPDTGALSLRRKKDTHGLCGNFDGERTKQVEVSYSVTNMDGVTQGHFIIIDLEVEE